MIRRISIVFVFFGALGVSAAQAKRPPVDTYCELKCALVGGTEAQCTYICTK